MGGGGGGSLKKSRNLDFFNTSFWRKAQKLVLA
jgi:hypothetical protein